MIFFSVLSLFIISVFPRSPLFPVHRKVGVFQINVVVGTVRHKSSGVEIKPAMVNFALNPDKWVLENNYNEKSARLKNSVEGISFSVMFLFKTAGSPLPKPVKVPIVALAVQAPAEGSSEPSRLQALVDMRRPLALTDGTPVTPTKRIVLPEHTAQPASTRPQALQPVDQQARFPPNNASLQLQTGADGRVRLVPSGQNDLPGASRVQFLLQLHPVVACVENHLKKKQVRTKIGAQFLLQARNPRRSSFLWFLRHLLLFPRRWRQKTKVLKMCWES